MTNMEEETYTCFFYGTLMALPILSRVIYGTQSPDPWQRDRLKIRPAILHDHCRHRVKNVDYPGVVPQVGKSVRGTLVEGLSKMDIERLDHFEGDEYDRIQVKVQVLLDESLSENKETHIEGETVQAGIYMWTMGTQFLEEGEWDFEQFTKLKLRNWVGDSKNFEFQESGTTDPMGGRWWQRPGEVDSADSSSTTTTAPTSNPASTNDSSK
ncbi:hypothetical protein ABW19_dt0202674 [Dactylella cylindrospora]|nr:hypothetical protein ABW19_dt0202674 [Dactylella cylindrospora]